MEASPNVTKGEQAFATDAARALETIVADLSSAVERLRRARPAGNDEFVEQQMTSVVDRAGRLATLLECGQQSLPPDVAGKQDFAADAARALETVVADMRSAVERVRQARPAGNDEFVEVQLRAVVAGAGQLATQLLAYAGKQSLQPKRLALLPFLREFAFRLREALDPRIVVSVDVAHDCPTCFVDAGALEDALLNLVVNARDAMPEGGRLSLAASGEVAPDGSPTVAVSVSDTGHGMPADFLQRALEPFVTTKTHNPRSGLGLSATDGFARQSGGRLVLSSLAGGGISATLTLPQAPSTTDLS
jgi:signal transduction histidine kinase